MEKRSGEAATVIVLSVIFFLGITAVLSSFFLNQKRTTNSQAQIVTPKCEVLYPGGVEKDMPCSKAGEWCIKCTGNRGPCAADAGVGLPYQCASSGTRVWTTPNMSGECNVTCKVEGVSSSSAPTGGTGGKGNGCFTMKAEFEPKKEGSKWAFYAWVTFDSATSGDVQLLYNDQHVAGWNGFGGHFTYDPNWTQPYSPGNYVAVATFETGTISANYHGYVRNCNPQDMTLHCSLGVVNGGPSVSGEGCACRGCSVSPTNGPSPTKSVSPTRPPAPSATPTVPAATGVQCSENSNPSKYGENLVECSKKISQNQSCPTDKPEEIPTSGCYGWCCRLKQGVNPNPPSTPCKVEKKQCSSEDPLLQTACTSLGQVINTSGSYYYASNRAIPYVDGQCNPINMISACCKDKNAEQACFGPLFCSAFECGTTFYERTGNTYYKKGNIYYQSSCAGTQISNIFDHCCRVKSGATSPPSPAVTQQQENSPTCGVPGKPACANASTLCENNGGFCWDQQGLPGIRTLPYRCDTGTCISVADFSGVITQIQAVYICNSTREECSKDIQRGKAEKIDGSGKTTCSKCFNFGPTFYCWQCTP